MTDEPRDPLSADERARVKRELRAETEAVLAEHEDEYQLELTEDPTAEREAEFSTKAMVFIPHLRDKIPLPRYIADVVVHLRREEHRAKKKLDNVLYSHYLKERRRRAITRRLDAEEAKAKAEAAGIKPVRDLVLTAAEAMALEPPPALVKDVLDGGGLSMLIGQRGSYKTAVALDIALCIATGKGWGRHCTTRGRALYVVGEGGGRAFGIRVEAWLKHHRLKHPGLDADALNDFRIVNGATPFMAERWEELVEYAREFTPALVVIDTLARHQLGLDENSNSDASEALARVDELRELVGCAVMVLHHPPKSGGNARGAGAWEGGADTVLMLEKDEPVPGQVEMTTTKQKHRDESGKWAFRIEQVQVAENGTWPTSMVPVHADPFVVDAAAEKAAAAAAQALNAEVLAYIGECEAAGMPVNKSEFDEHFAETRRREAARGSLRELLARGEVRRVSGKHGAQRFHVAAAAEIIPFTGAQERDSNA